MKILLHMDKQTSKIFFKINKIIMDPFGNEMTSQYFEGEKQHSSNN